jgi:hypothetical protein
MNPQQLFLADGTVLKKWSVCGSCHSVFANEYKLCPSCTCVHCHKERPTDPVINSANGSHPECSEQHYRNLEAKRMDKAVLVEDYAGPFLVNDEVYLDTDDLLDNIPLEELPEYDYCTTYKPPVLNYDKLMSVIAENLHEDWEPVPVPDLVAAIDMWNEANQNNGSYLYDHKKKWSKALLLKQVQ